MDLKAELTNRGLTTKGVKADLVQRLTEHDENSIQAEEGLAADDKIPSNEAVSTIKDVTKHAISELQSVAKDSTLSDATANEILATQTEPIPNTEAEAQAQHKPAIPQESAPSGNHTENYEQPDQDTPLPPTDTVADLQKRKRRSSTPPPSAKRARQEDQRLAEACEDVVDFDNGDISISPKKSQNGVEKKEVLPKDVETVGEDQRNAKRVNITESLESPPISLEQTQGPSLDETGEDAHAKRVVIEESSKVLPSQPKHAPIESIGEADTPQHLSQSKEESHGDARFDVPLSQGVKLEETSALSSSHPPTSALYIRELMRPLRSELLEQYIIDLVTPSGQEPDPELIQDFYLDQIRTHAFVLLPSVSAAQRIRVALHNQVWPNERNRKSLWVDFIPADSVKDWITREESAPRGARWEVAYEQGGSKVVAVHREVGSDSKSFSRPPPTGPAAASGPVYPGIEAAPRGPRGGGGRLPFQNPSVRQTETFPQLAYIPKDEDVALRRVGNMRSFYSRDPPADLGKDYHRYTFEGADTFVDRGREVFIGIRPPHRQKEHEARLRRDRLGTAGGGSIAESRRDDYRPIPRPSVPEEDRLLRYNDGRRSDRPPRGRGFRSDRGPGRFRGEDPYRYRPGY